MHLLKKASIALLALAAAQVAYAGSTTQLLAARTTLPIVFTRGVDANHAHVGDVVSAKTIQEVKLSDGAKLPAGSQVSGHVVETNPFAFDRTPYARQKQSTLSIHFDTVRSGDVTLPLNVTVRAMADPITSSDAREPSPNADNTYITFTQIGGDIVSPSQDEVISEDGDVVAYKRHGGIYAHLISSTGKAPNGCDTSNTEESTGLYSASACGLYGFTGNELEQTSNGAQPSTFVLVSRRRGPKIWKNSTALLEVLSADMASGSR